MSIARIEFALRRRDATSEAALLPKRWCFMSHSLKSSITLPAVCLSSYRRARHCSGHVCVRQIRLNSPVRKRERVAELLDTLVMGGVTCHQLQALVDRNSGNHRVGPTDRLADAVKIAGDASGQFSGGRIQWENLFGSDGVLAATNN